MDTLWFKRAQKRAGVTSWDLGEAIGRDRTVISRLINGTQTMTIDQARAFAKALNEPLEEVMHRAGLLQEDEKPLAQPGFRDAEAAPWVPRQEMSREDRDRQLRFAAHLGMQKGVDVWEVKTRAMALAGYLPGDKLLVDLRAPERARDGSIVVAQVYDLDQGSAKTVLRQYQRPALVAHSAAPDDWKAWVVDERNVSIRGVVAASWRGGI